MVISRAFLEIHLINMKNHVEGRLAELVFNIDEVGSSDWDDRTPNRVLVFSDMTEETVIHAIPKRFRYVTSVSCISVTGDALCPIVITEYPISDSLWINDLC
jgi:hypothetical protein